MIVFGVIVELCFEFEKNVDKDQNGYVVDVGFFGGCMIFVFEQELCFVFGLFDWKFKDCKFEWMVINDGYEDVCIFEIVVNWFEDNGVLQKIKIDKEVVFKGD